MHNEHKLLFANHEVGTIVQYDFDFPRAFGRYAITLPDDDDPVHQHIHAYVRYSVEACRLMDLDNGPGGDRDHYQAEHEHKFMDLIESDDWWLVDGRRKTNIMIPCFCTDHGVVWTLN